MNRTRTHRFLLLVALSHLFVDVALAGGAVLCVAPNDHSAIEIGHLAPSCEALYEAKTPESDAKFTSYARADCTDTPLHAEAEMASKRISADVGTPPAHVTYALLMPQLIAADIERPIQNRLDHTMTIRAHRTTVLLI